MPPCAPTLKDRVLRRIGSETGPGAAAAPAPRDPASTPRRRRPHRHVVVVTYGRSGSTLVQGLLNTLPRTVVRGENNLYVLDLFRALSRLRGFRDLHLRHNPRGSHTAFFGLHEITPRSFVKSARDLVHEHLLGDVDPAEVDVLGFKEVAWHRLKPEEFAPFFDYLDKVLPRCRYVLNERDADQVVGSGFWKGHARDDVEAAIRRTEEIQMHLRETRGDRVLDLHYEKLTHADAAVADEQLRRIAEFVHGSAGDDLIEQMRETRKVGHGPFPFGQSRGARPRAANVRARKARRAARAAGEERT